MRVIINITSEQSGLFQAAASKAGLPVSSWMRSIAVSAARNLGVNPGRDAATTAAYELKLAKLKAREQHEAGVSERRAKREERKRAIAIAKAAWEDLERCAAAREELSTSGNAQAILEAEESWSMANDRAVSAQAVVDALEA